MSENNMLMNIIMLLAVIALLLTISILAILLWSLIALLRRYGLDGCVKRSPFRREGAEAVPEEHFQSVRGGIRENIYREIHENIEKSVCEDVKETIQRTDLGNVFQQSNNSKEQISKQPEKERQNADKRMTETATAPDEPLKEAGRRKEHEEPVKQPDNGDNREQIDASNKVGARLNLSSSAKHSQLGSVVKYTESPKGILQIYNMDAHKYMVSICQENISRKEYDYYKLDSCFKFNKEIMEGYTYKIICTPRPCIMIRQGEEYCVEKQGEVQIEKIIN